MWRAAHVLRHRRIVARWQQARGLKQEKVSVTLSAFLLSVLSGNTPHAHAAARGSDDMRMHRTPSLTPDEEELHRCKVVPQIVPNDRDRFPGNGSQKSRDREVGG